MPQLTGRDVADAATEQAQSALAGWESVRARYSEQVQERVGAVMARGGLTLADLVAMTLAEYEGVLEARRSLPRREVSARVSLTSVAARLRTQLRELVQLAGGGVDPDAPVPIPEHIDEILRSEPDYDRDLLSE